MPKPSGSAGACPGEIQGLVPQELQIGGLGIALLPSCPQDQLTCLCVEGQGQGGHLSLTHATAQQSSGAVVLQTPGPALLVVLPR